MASPKKKKKGIFDLNKTIRGRKTKGRVGDPDPKALNQIRNSPTHHWNYITDVFNYSIMALRL